MSYKYWNEFVNNWRHLPVSEYINPSPTIPYNLLLNWHNPNLTPLLNSPHPADFSLKYLPEPWWGNNGAHALNSIVINYNPGNGGNIQNYVHSTGLYGNPNFQTFANNEALRVSNNFIDTNRWHKAKRSSRVFNALNRNGIALGKYTNLCNHLSIELIPWHTPNSTYIGNYISNNLQEIYDHSIVFAAQESNRISNPLLHNKVLLRLSGTTTLNLFESFRASGICNYTILTPIGYTPGLKGGYLKVSISSIPNVQFVSIWGKIGNDFPPDTDMDWIFNHII